MMFDVFLASQHLSRHRYSQIIIKVFIIVCSVPAPSQLLEKRIGIIANAIMPNSPAQPCTFQGSNRHKHSLVRCVSPAYQARPSRQGVLHNQRLQSRLRSFLSVPIISYYVKSTPLTHATPAASLSPPCQRFYFKNFVESSCIKFVLRTAYTLHFCNVRLFLFYLQSFPLARFARVAYKKKHPCQLGKKCIVSVGLPAVGFYFL